MLNLKKKLRKLKNQISFTLVTILLTSLFCTVANGSEFWLISENEYSLLKVDNTLDLKLGLAYNKGPKINLIEPNINNAVLAPVNIYIKFEKSPSGSKPQMNTLIVKMKGIISLDITKRVEKFINGTELNIENANIPRGKHNILIMIMDADNNYSERLISFIVI